MFEPAVRLVLVLRVNDLLVKPGRGSYRCGLTLLRAIAPKCTRSFCIPRAPSPTPK